MIRAAIFFSLLGSMVLGNLLWWRHAHRAVAGLRYGRAIRIAVAVWSVAMFATFTLMFASRWTGGRVMDHVPVWLLAFVFLWHLLFVLGWVIWRGVRNTAVVATRLMRAKPQAVADAPLSNRRQFLAGAAVLTPPVLTMLAGWHGVRHLDEFRINRVTLRIPGLPPPLVGMTIAHVSDLHIGKYTDDVLLAKVVEQTNQLRADLVLFTGDLIDFALADLPAGLAMMKRLDPRFGLSMCEGNHDLFQGRFEFERQVRAAGFHMPINASHRVAIRGQEVQLLSLRWGGPNVLDKSLASSEELIADSMRVLMPQVKAGAFPILLAHHPHAFDFLGDAPIPLTLAGHTHGGQINPAPWFRPAKLRFRYLSGLYERDGRKLFVSNGVGNWFPLRVNAPAEIVQITLEGQG